MKLTILGSGAAGGVPMVSVGWGRCDPSEPRNRRMRPSVMVEHAETRIVVDTTPDLREQLLRADVRHIDAVLYTHAHADHVHGIDDLREVNRAMGRSIPCHGDARTVADLENRFAYAFAAADPRAAYVYKPMLETRLINGPFSVGSIPVVPFDQDHGVMRTVGFRFGPIAYSTDLMALPEESFAALDGVRIWVVGCLTDTPHSTHAHVDKVVEWARQVRPERTILTHMSPRLDYRTLLETLPEGIEPGYDGMELVAD